jgi:hypothetical protein
MKQPRSARFWNNLLLGTLVLLVTGAALCTVAASAATESRGPAAAAGTGASP